MKGDGVGGADTLNAISPYAVPVVWRGPLLLFSSALLAVLVLYWPTALAMVDVWWRSETYAHGMLVLPIVGYMVWTRREYLQVLPPQMSLLGLVALAGACLLWLLGYAADVLVAQQLALIGMIPALVWTFLGWPVLWALAFPMFYLIFAVPFGEGLVYPLMDFTALFTVKALQLSGMPVFWEGRFIQIPSGNFEVAEACSGLRYLIASLALGCLYAYLSYRSLWRRLLFIGLAIIVPIIANGIRAYGIVMLAHLSGMTLAVGVDHIIYGWLFFGLVVLAMFWLGSLWREPDDAVPAAGVVPPPPQTVGRQRYVLATVLIAAGLITLGPWLALRSGGALPATPVVLTAPTPDGWTAIASPLPEWQPAFQGASAELHQAYSAPDNPVRLFLAYYRQQQQGAELINSLNSLYNSDRWRFIREGVQRVALADGERELMTLTVAAGDTQRLIWYWYRIDGRSIASPFEAKLWEAFYRLFGNGEGSALVALATEFEGRPEQAEARLRQFLQTAEPAIDQTLDQAR